MQNKDRLSTPPKKKQVHLDQEISEISDTNNKKLDQSPNFFISTRPQSNELSFSYNDDDQQQKNQTQQNLFMVCSPNQQQKYFCKSPTFYNSESPIISQKSKIQKNFVSPMAFQKFQPEKLPYKTIDTPLINQNFYCNMISWSSKDKIAICQDKIIHQYESKENKISLLLERDKEFASVKYSPQGDMLANGTMDGQLEIIDIISQKTIHLQQDHQDRLGVLQWQDNNILISGSKDNKILIHDIRIQQNSQTLGQHQDEICSIVFSQQQLAVGDNDGKIKIYDMRQQNQTLQNIDAHDGPIKALEWSPINSNILINAGGLNKFNIKQWNVLQQRETLHANVESQVSNLFFSKNGDKFISTHGNKDNDIKIWDFKMTQINQLEKSSFPILYSAMSPNKDEICIASHQTLKFWKIFQNNQKQVYDMNKNIFQNKNNISFFSRNGNIFQKNQSKQ